VPFFVWKVLPAELNDVLLLRGNGPRADVPKVHMESWAAHRCTHTRTTLHVHRGVDMWQVWQVWQV
jgi:hypothetical protein